MRILAISITSNPILEDIQKAFPQDPYFGEIISCFPSQATQETFKDYLIKDGLLHFKERLCVPSSLKNQVMKEAHETPLAAHLGYHKMFASPNKPSFIQG